METETYLPFCLGEQNMKTEDILNLDCRKEENRIKLNSFLYKVKPIQKRMEKLGRGRRAEVPMEVLEEVMQGLCLSVVSYPHRTLPPTPSHSV